MRVVLAGYNIDRDVIDDLKRRASPRQDVTPETLSAAYARISRDPRPADELRAAARQEVERARRSNQTIIFKMGHHSVAEHAVFNFDIIGVSRLALEEKRTLPHLEAARGPDGPVGDPGGRRTDVRPGERSHALELPPPRRKGPVCRPL
jgi:hypothetical protein